MKLSNLTAKLTCVKGNTIATLAAGALAAGLFFTAVPAAHAQFGIGVQIGGGPVAVQGYYGGDGDGDGSYAQGYYPQQPPVVYGDGDGDGSYAQGYYNQGYYPVQPTVIYNGGYGYRGWGGDDHRWGGDDHRGWGGDDHRGWGGEHGGWGHHDH